MSENRELQNSDSPCLDPKDSLDSFLTIAYFKDAIVQLCEAVEVINGKSSLNDIDASISPSSMESACLKWLNLSWLLLHNYQTLTKRNEALVNARNNVLSDNKLLAKWYTHLKSNILMREAAAEEREAHLEQHVTDLTKELKVLQAENRELMALVETMVDNEQNNVAPADTNTYREIYSHDSQYSDGDTSCEESKDSKHFMEITEIYNYRSDKSSESEANELINNRERPKRRKKWSENANQSSSLNNWFSCEHCDCVFQSKSTLRRHINYHHTKVTNAEIQ